MEPARQPLAEIQFPFRGKKYLAWIDTEVSDGCRDVMVYEIHGGEYRFVGAGILGELTNKFRPVDIVDDDSKCRLNPALAKELARVLSTAALGDA